MEIKNLGLNERQVSAIDYVKKNGKITNKEYRTMTGLSDEGARKDLMNILDKNVFIIKGKGRASHFVLKSVGD